MRAHWQPMLMRATRSFSSVSHPLSVEKLTPQILNCRYAVRGEMVTTAEFISEQLAAGDASYPFKSVTYCNVGNPQSLHQKPIDYYRSVLAILEYPALADKHADIFASDIVERARRYLSYCGSVGAYSHSQGIPQIRDSVASFITRRDGVTDPSYCSPDNIFLTDGASPGVQLLLKFLIRDEKDGIMIPIPQYPLYSAAIPLYGGSQVDYYLDESKGWSLSVEELARSYSKSVEGGVTPRALCIINPGNPTGQNLSVSNMQAIVEFCAKNNLVLLADEVYQENIYTPGDKFTSFKKVVSGMPVDIRDAVQLVSFHSTSKGVIGECGKRGGYFELYNVGEDVKAQMYKLQSINLCPNVIGQYTVGLMVEPPAPEEESYNHFQHQRAEIFDSLQRRALVVVKALNALEGVQCNTVEGAMYAFPSITLTPTAVKAAAAANQPPDQFYCLELLKATGICVIPGSGFGQVDGTFHFRTTILPQEEVMAQVMESMGEFHRSFIAKYP